MPTQEQFKNLANDIRATMLYIQLLEYMGNHEFASIVRFNMDIQLIQIKNQSHSSVGLMIQSLVEKQYKTFTNCQ